MMKCANWTKEGLDQGKQQADAWAVLGLSTRWRWWLFFVSVF